MNEKMKSWIHDDITWCTEDNCPLVNCRRNTKNMWDRTGLHSFASFRETDECPIYVMQRDADLEREGVQE